MKYINQLDYPELLYVTRANPEHPRHETGKTTTVRSSGCGLCAAIMVADRLLPNCEFDLTDAITLAYASGANHQVGTDYCLYAPALAEKLGLRLEMTDDLQALRHCMRSGGAAVARVRGDRDGKIGLFTRNGHYIAVIGEEPDGRLAILDPSYRPGKFEEDGRQGKVEMVNDVIALCDAETLAEEGNPNYASFYLFWRK